MKNYRLKINGKAYDVDVPDIEGNMTSIVVNGISYNVEVDYETFRPGSSPVAIKQRQVSAAKPAVEKVAGKAALVKAPLPGVIIQVLVKQGDEIIAGQTLCTLETMKMENAIKSETGGKITAVKVAPGQTVNQDEVLVEIN
jgi:glutaconyl-CoA/methylmalonyl-CoA decarboxylase subunit gamma